LARGGAFEQELITKSEWLEKSEETAQKTAALLIVGSLTDSSVRLSDFCKKPLKSFDALWTFSRPLKTV